MAGVSASRGRRGDRRLSLMAAAAVVTLLAGCSSVPSFSSSSLSSLFGSKSAPASTDAQAATQPPVDIECPGVTVREGASTYTLSANPAEPNAMNVRYQVGIGQTARECRVAGGVVTLRVGVQGRVILGPAGGPGQFIVPLRFAVVHEGPEPKPIVTKLAQIPITIGEGQDNVPFTHVE